MTQEELIQYLKEIADKKATNVTTSLERIKLLRNILAEHAGQLGFSIAANPKVITNDDPTLEDIVKVYNTILKRDVPSLEENTTAGDIVVDNQHKVVVAPGYYKQSFTITGAGSKSDADAAVKEALDSLKRDILANAANPDKVLVGSKAIVITENPTTGELVLSYQDGTVGAKYVTGSTDTRLSAGSKANDSTLIVTSSDGTELASKIPYYEGGEKEVKISVKEGASLGDSPEKVDVLEVNKLPKGYYAQDLQILPVFNLDNANKVINVETDKSVVVREQNVTISPSKGFDYIKSANISVKEGSVSFTVNAIGNTITLTSDVLGGWITPEKASITAGNNVTVNKSSTGTYTVILPTVTSEDGTATVGSDDVDQDSKQELVVTPAKGYYDGQTAIKATLNGNAVKYIDSIPDVVISDAGIPTIAITPGIIGNTITKELQQAATEVDRVQLTTPSKEVIIDQKESFINTTEGYAKRSTIPITVKDASTPVLTTQPADNGTSSVVINIEQSGWIEGTTDVTQQFAVLAQQYANGLVDKSGGVISDSEIQDEGQVVFSYDSTLGTAVSGIQFKKPTDSAKYFTSAKVDLSQLINDIDNI